MTHTISEWFRTHEKGTLLVLALLFVLIRLPGVNLPLHQDEYKWPMIVNPAYHSEVSIPHPPLSQFIYRTAGYVVGFNTHFRFVPLFFGTVNLLLLYYFMRFVYGKREALAASLVWVFSYFSVLASLMVDTDGEVMPFFFLLALIGYYKSKKASGRERVGWLLLLALGCIGGFFIKVSFLLALCAIGADFLWEKKGNMTLKQVFVYCAYAMLGLGLLVILLLLAHTVFPFFDLKTSVSYWEHFWTGNRDWFQTFIQCAKALLYTSPFLILLPLLGRREVLTRSKLFIFFLLGAVFFYVILFDFSLGALDRYFQFLILPLSVINGLVLAQFSREKNMDRNSRVKEFVLLGSVVALCFALLQSLPHVVPSLHPKAEWLTRVFHFKWNFVYPFSGGSGPLGFYVSFLFIAMVWIVSVFAVGYGLYKPKCRALTIAFLIPLGLAYNLVFTEEYLVGVWNGSAPKLLTHAVEFIKKDSDIKMVTTYNDNGGNEIRDIGKYRKRLYTDPKFDINEKVASLNLYKEHYFVLDVPRLDPSTVYQKYFDSCRVVYKEVDKKMSATVFDCRGVPDVKI